MSEKKDLLCNKQRKCYGFLYGWKRLVLIRFDGGCGGIQILFVCARHKKFSDRWMFRLSEMVTCSLLTEGGEDINSVEIKGDGVAPTP